MVLSELEQQILLKREDRELAKIKPLKGAHIIIWAIALILSFSIGPNNASVWVPILAIAAVFSILVQLHKSSVYSQHRLQIRSDRKHREKFISTALQNKTNDGFCLSREIRDIDAEFAIAIDKANKKWLLVFGDIQEVLTFNFNDLIDYELCQDGKSLVSGAASGALAGGLVFGTVGAIAGASSVREIIQNCIDLHINLSVNNVKCPHYQLPFIVETVANDSNEYKYEIGFANEIMSLLTFIKANSTKKSCKQFESAVDSATDKYDEIKKIKELLDAGIITQDEFNAKKKQLLDL